jgi:hypothetical protein
MAEAALDVQYFIDCLNRCVLFHWGSAAEMNIVDRLPLQWNCLGLNFRFGWAVAHRNFSFLAGCAFGGLGDIKHDVVV